MGFFGDALASASASAGDPSGNKAPVRRRAVSTEGGVEADGGLGVDVGVRVGVGVGVGVGVDEGVDDAVDDGDDVILGVEIGVNLCLDLGDGVGVNVVVVVT